MVPVEKLRNLALGLALVPSACASTVPSEPTKASAPADAACGVVDGLRVYGPTPDGGRGYVYYPRSGTVVRYAGRGGTERAKAPVSTESGHRILALASRIREWSPTPKGPGGYVTGDAQPPHIDITACGDEVAFFQADREGHPPSACRNGCRTVAPEVFEALVRELDGAFFEAR